MRASAAWKRRPGSETDGPNSGTICCAVPFAVTLPSSSVGHQVNNQRFVPAQPAKRVVGACRYVAGVSKLADAVRQL